MNQLSFTSGHSWAKKRKTRKKRGQGKGLQSASLGDCIHAKMPSSKRF